MALHYHLSDQLTRNAGGYEADISTQLLRMGCAICGRPLRDPISLERGWGPVCDEKFMMGGTERVWAQMEADFNPDEAALAMREAPTVEPMRWLEPIINQETGKPYIERTFKKGEELPDGTKAQGGEIVTKTKPIRPGSLRDYWIGKGGDPDDPNAPWRTSAELRRTMVSNGIWYASRAVSFGFDGSVVSAEKVDPKWMVVAAVQRFARAVGLPGAANRMTEFYGAKMVKYIQAQTKATKKASAKKGIVFEHVPATYQIEQWDAQARRKRVMAVGDHAMRVHVPYSQEFNNLAWENKDIFFGREGEKDQWSYALAKTQAMYWRYFNQRDLRQVVNIISGVFGDQMCITRKMLTVEDRKRKISERLGKVCVLDVSTGTARLFPREIADQLVSRSEYESVNSRGEPVLKPGRYRIVKDK
jgi:extradiol dioxygenase family protein